MIKLDVKKICYEREVTVIEIAKRMYAAEIYSSVESSRQILQKYIANKIMSIDIKLLEFLCKEFNYKPKDIVIWK